LIESITYPVIGLSKSSGLRSDLAASTAGKSAATPSLLFLLRPADPSELERIRIKIKFYIQKH